MLVCGIDFEATGTDYKTARAIEVGAILWESDGWKEKERYNALMWEEDYPHLTNEVQQLTGITQDELTREGSLPKGIFQELTNFIDKSNFIVAHNKEYDAGIFESELRRHKFSLTIPGERWLCTYRDVPYSDRFRCKKLAHLTLDHGVPIDPTKLHRAVNDVELMGKLLRAGNYTLEKMIEYRDSPWVYLQAMIPPPWEDGGKGKKEASNRGYTYQKARGTETPEFPKCWVKRVKEIDEDREKESECPFKRKIIFRER